MKTGDKISFINDIGVFNWLNSISTVFDLENTEILEDYNLAIYLLALYQYKLINSEIEIHKCESPDFIIHHKNDGTSIGLEITHTTIQDHFKNLKEAQKYPGSIIEISSGKSFLRKQGEPLCCPPFYGNQAE